VKPARPAAGAAGGVLGGRYPNPAWGLPMGGMQGFDDFIGNINKTTMRTQLNWTIVDTSGGVSPTAGTDTATEDGILRMATAGALGDGGNAYLPDGLLGAGVPTYLEFGVKIRMPATNTDLRVWSGFADTSNGDWLIAGSVNCVGIRAIASGSAVNWYGVVKDGSTASNESTVDLGYEANSTWRSLGFYVTSTGIQFCEWDASDLRKRGLVRTDIGDEVTTNIPTGALYKIALGINAATAAQRVAEVDWWAFGGPVAR
jgi:hypothetical protein